MAGNPNDPFGDPSDSNRTMVRPGGSRPQPGAPQPQGGPQTAYQPPPQPQQPAPAFDPPQYQAPPQDAFAQQPVQAAPQPRLAAAAAGRLGSAPIDSADLARGAGTPLAAAAVPLLGLSARLRSMTGQVDVNAVRENVYQELHGFAKAGREAGVQPELLRASHYAVAATIDDVVMNTPWGAHSGWNKRTMVSAFHGDVEGGERFYSYLERMTQAPTVNRPVLHIMYECMSLGFIGRYRLRQRGPAEHDQVREKVWQILRNLAGPMERELSPDWRGVDAPARLQHRRIPIWLVAAIAALLAALIFGGFLLALDGRSGSAEGRLSGVIKTGEIDLPKAPNQPPPQPVVIPPPPPPETADFEKRLRVLLKKEIDEGVVTVTTQGKALKITINMRDMFESGSAKLKPDLERLLVRIGQELKTPEGQGQVQVQGHTDSDPIATREFPNNQALSKARAQNSANILIGQTGSPSRYEIVGRGVDEPVASNATPQGKARNRRIEVLLVKPDA